MHVCMYSIIILFRMSCHNLPTILALNIKSFRTYLYFISFSKYVFVYLAVSGLSSIMWDFSLWHVDPLVLAHRLSCSNRGLNLCPLHSKADSKPFYHQECPPYPYFPLSIRNRWEWSQP